MSRHRAHFDAIVMDALLGIHPAVMLTFESADFINTELKQLYKTRSVLIAVCQESVASRTVTLL